MKEPFCKKASAKTKILLILLLASLLFLAGCQAKAKKIQPIQALNQSIKDLGITSNTTFTMSLDVQLQKFIVDCEGLISAYMNKTKRLEDYTGFTMYAVDKCYDFNLMSKEQLAYENEKWTKLNSCWTVNNKTIGWCEK